MVDWSERKILWKSRNEVSLFERLKTNKQKKKVPDRDLWTERSFLKKVSNYKLPSYVFKKEKEKSYRRLIYLKIISKK